MRIGIDARLINETGVGRYIRNLIRDLGLQDKTNEYVVFLRTNAYDAFTPPNTRWTKAYADVPWHTIAEQLIMPWVFLKARLDLVHIPYFNIPIFYPGKMMATTHDLTILHFDTGKATTLPIFLYKLRRIGYRVALEVGLRRVQKIIAVSHATKQELLDHFHLTPENIVVTYEGVDDRLSRQSSVVSRQEKLITEPYFLYVGNAYPHKNLETLISAFKLLITHYPLPVTLVLVGKDDFFYRRIKEFVRGLNVDDNVIFFGEADDTQLASLYTHANALVFPSLMEGFGLPALEALSFGCPVIASDIPVFHEILGSQATYFNPSDPRNLKDKLTSAVGSHKKPDESGVHQLLNTYSWSRLASDTLAVYERCLRL